MNRLQLYLWAVLHSLKHLNGSVLSDPADKGALDFVHRRFRNIQELSFCD